MKQPIRVYADTSVFGGFFDSQYTSASREFISNVRRNIYELVISPHLADELQLAPAPVRDLFARVRPNAEWMKLRKKY